MDVTIADEYLDQIKVVLAFPSVDNIILTDAQIKNFCVWPAMRRYFIKFPIKVQAEETISSNSLVTIDYPDDYTYGVTDVRVVDKNNVGGATGNFWEMAASQSRSYSSKSTGSYGIKNYNPNSVRQYSQNYRLAMSSYENQYNTIDTRIDQVNRQVNVFSTMSGKINVEWAKYSINFADVRFEYQEDVIKLSQSYLLDHLADTTQIIETGSDVSINFSELRGRATELRDPIIEKWDSIPDVIVLRVT